MNFFSSSNLVLFLIGTKCEPSPLGSATHFLRIFTTMFLLGNHENQKLPVRDLNVGFSRKRLQNRLYKHVPLLKPGDEKSHGDMYKENISEQGESAKTNGDSVVNVQ